MAERENRRSLRPTRREVLRSLGIGAAAAGRRAHRREGPSPSRPKQTDECQVNIRLRAKILPAAALVCLMFTGSCQVTTDYVDLPSDPYQLNEREDRADVVLPNPSSTGATMPSVAEETDVVVAATPLLEVTRLPVFRMAAWKWVRGKKVYGEEGPEVIPLAWSDEPIPLKIIAADRGEIAVVDFYERALTVYRGDDNPLPGDVINGVTITQNGGLVVATADDSLPRVAYFPDSDLGQTPRALRPSRTSATLHGFANTLDILADQEGSLVWMLQYDDQQIDTDQAKTETWVDLVDVDTGEAVMTADIEGEYWMAGVVDEGLLLGGNGIHILGRDGNLREIAIERVMYHWILAAHGQQFAVQDKDGEIEIIDIESNRVHPITKPEPGTWTRNGIPFTYTRSIAKTRSDSFVIGFRPTEGDWSLYEIGLSSKSIRKLGEYPTPQLIEKEEKHLHKPLFSSVSAADGESVLAFTGWPTDPLDSTTISIVDDTGSLVPIVRLPLGFFVLDAA